MFVDADPLLDVTETARITGLKAATLRDQCRLRRHAVPVLRLGRGLLFQASDLSKWIDANASDMTVEAVTKHITRHPAVGGPRDAGVRLTERASLGNATYLYMNGYRLLRVEGQPGDRSKIFLFEDPHGHATAAVAALSRGSAAAPAKQLLSSFRGLREITQT